MNRRQLLKTAAAIPFVPFASRMHGLPWGSAGECGCINILLHGLFFMEVQGDMMVVATPVFDGHTFVYRDNGGSPQPLSGIIDLRDNLKQGTDNKFSDRILNFSKASIKFPKKYFIDFNSTAKYKCLLLLPIPAEIRSLRVGSVKDFLDNAKNGSIKTSIKTNCTNAALVVRLKYFASANKPPFVTRSYYAEHCPLPDFSDVNKALYAAKKAFGDQFDLEMTGASNNNVARDKDQDLPNEIDPDDEKALGELPNCPPKKRAVEPATCPIFGVS